MSPRFFPPIFRSPSTFWTPGTGYFRGSSRKRTALLTAAFKKGRFSQLPYKLRILTFPYAASFPYSRLHKSPFFSTPMRTLYFYIPVSGQLQLRTPFPRPVGVPCSRELPLYTYMNRPSNKRSTKQSWYAKTILPLMEDLQNRNTFFSLPSPIQVGQY